MQTYKEERSLARIEECVQRGGEVSYVLDLGDSISKAATYVRVLSGASIGIARETVNDIVDMSLRTVRNDLNLNAIIRNLVQRFRGSGGGHPKVAEARVPQALFKEFVEALNNSVGIAKKVIDHVKGLKSLTK